MDYDNQGARKIYAIPKHPSQTKEAELISK